MKATARANSGDPQSPDAAGLFRAIFEQAAIGVAQNETATGRYIRVNQRYCDIVGYSREEMERLDFQTLTHPDDLAADLDNMRRLVAGDIREFTMEKRYRHKEGRVVWVNLTVSPLWAPGEPPNFHIAVVEDITEHKRAQESLQRSEEMFRRTFDLSPVGAVVVGLDHRFIRCNAAFCRFLRCAETELLGRTFLDVTFPEDRLIGGSEIRALVAGSLDRTHLRKRYVRKDAVVVWGEVSINLVRDALGQPLFFLSIVQDITERKRAEEARQKALSLYHDLVETSQDLIWQCDIEGKYNYLNPAWEVVFGYRIEEMLGRPFADFQSPEYAARDTRKFACLMQGGSVKGYESVHRAKDGRELHLVFNAKFLQDDTGRIIGTRGTAYDITERKRAEEALKQSEERMRLVLDSVEKVAVQGYRSDGTVTFWNRASEQLYGYTAPEAIGGNLVDLIIPPEMREDVERVIAQMAATGQSIPAAELSLMRKDRSRVAVFSSHAIVQKPGHAPELFCVDIDLSEHKRAEAEKEKLQAQLLQAQKMESVGRLAGGVAHDFNNMLQAILGNAALALQDLPSDSPVRESLEEIQKSAKRSADLTRQLLAFARKQTIAPKVLDLNDTVAAMLKMLRRLIGEDIELAWLPGADLWPIKVDPSQIDQILANLCVNARDAIADTGKVTLETSNVTLDDTYARSHLECVPGDYVMLAVSDTGQGMDDETRTHLFEPFFTTKEVGKGTGLGLATVFGIVKQNRGLISVYSEPGQGTTFKFYLPRAEAEVPVAVQTTVRRSLRGTETVLVVEDEEQILHLGRRILAQQGYTVLVASAPEAAMVVVARHAGPIHLLITDVVMPGMNGKELLARLRTSHPQLKCLFMSGYTADVIAHHGVLEDGVQFLQKPFTIQTLAEKVRGALDQPMEP